MEVRRIYKKISMVSRKRHLTIHVYSIYLFDYMEHQRRKVEAFDMIESEVNLSKASDSGLLNVGFFDGFKTL